MERRGRAETNALPQAQLLWWSDWMTNDVRPPADPELPGGYSAYPGERVMSKRIADFIESHDLHYGGEVDFSEDELLGLAHSPGFEWQRDMLIVEHKEEIAGVALTWQKQGMRVTDGFIGVHWDHTARGLEEYLLHHVEERAAEHFDASAGRRVWLGLDVKDESQIRVLQAAGYESIRRFYSMLKPIGDDEAPASEHDGFTVRRGTWDDARLIHELLQDTFAEHWGFSPEPFETWWKQVSARTDVDPSLWFIAQDEQGDAAAFLVGVEMADIGYIEDLGVRKHARGRGLGAWLLRHAFAEFSARGFRKASLGVDTDNATGALHLYLRVGMEPLRVYETYAKTFTPG